MAGPSSLAGGTQRASEVGDPLEASHRRRLMRSAVLASLAPFFLLSLGHYFSVNLLFVHYAVQKLHFARHRGEYFSVFGDSTADADALVRTEMTVAAVSFSMLCLSWAAILFASAAVNSGQGPTARDLLSRMKGVLRGKPTITRTYSTVMLLGYVLSLILVVLVVFVVVLVSGEELSSGVLQFLLCLLALLLFVYLVVVVSVGAGASQQGGGESGLDALCRAGALMEERTLLGFLVFFLSLVVTRGFLGSHGLWRDDLLYGVETTAVELSPGPALTNAVWMVGACGLFGYAGVLLQV